jgi:hypothetical protein
LQPGRSATGSRSAAKNGFGSKNETSIGYEKAVAIAAVCGVDRDEIRRSHSYYIATDTVGGEHLTDAGQDEPLATNFGTTSWLSPGFPAVNS